MHERIPHPAVASAAGGGVDVWRVDLHSVGEHTLHGLSAAEHQRASAIAHAERRALWMRGRGVLRVLLGAYLQRPPHAIELLRGPHGKPALAEARGGRGGHPPLHFNLSHSGPLALYAFTVTAPLGVNVELARARPLDEVALAERAFGSAAAQRLRALPAPAREREFLRLWVRHEAALKCLGRGLTGSACATATDPEPAGSGLQAPRARGSDISRLWIAELDLGPHIAAALALQGAPQEPRLHEWPADGGPTPIV